MTWIPGYHNNTCWRKRGRCETTTNLLPNYPGGISAYKSADIYSSGSSINTLSSKYLATGLTIPENWCLSIDLKLPDQSTAKWKNVFGFQVEGTTDHAVGSRIPAVWIRMGLPDVIVHITNMIATESNSAIHNYAYDLQSKSNTGNWFNLKLSQKDGFYEIKIDDELIHKVLNTEPRTWTDVKLIMGNDYGTTIYDPATGEYRNFEMTSTCLTQLQTSTMDLESLQKTKRIELINPADVLQRSLATKEQTVGIKMKRKLMCQTPETSCMHDLQYFYDGSLLSSDDFVLKNSYQSLNLTFFVLPKEY